MQLNFLDVNIDNKLNLKTLIDDLTINFNKPKISIPVLGLEINLFYAVWMTHICAIREKQKSGEDII